MRRPPAGRLLALVLAAATFAACREKEAAPSSAGRPGTPRARRPPLLVVGIDGADLGVVRRLWAQGRLPNLKRLADGGAHGALKTAYGLSPVIWTTIATGRKPEDHGITDFVVNTDGGPVPVSSAVRRVPALWNMASRAGLRTALLGWWASWPAEEIDGLVVTDRVHLTRDRAVHPPSELAAVERARVEAKARYPGFGGRLPDEDPWMNDGAVRDRIIAHEARRVAGSGFDLMMVYFRTVDIASHRYWKYFEPFRYPGTLRRMSERLAHVVPTVYDATDQALGDVLAACPPGTNVLVVSDHGFVAGPEVPFVYINTERLLERLGFLVRNGETIDFPRTVAYPVDSPGHSRVKLLRLAREGREAGGRVTRARAPRELDRLARALEGVTYASGKRVFAVKRTDLPPQVDLAAEVNLINPSLRVRAGAETWDDVVRYINSITGTHSDTTDGLFLAWGPDLRPGAAPEGFSVLDLAPTLLYALGLPVAEDFAGKARTDLFTDAFRARRALRTIPTWGTMAGWRVEGSSVDARLMEELRALGYLAP